jgi:Uma2 family endonuclease
MPFMIEETWLPATLTAPPMNDEQFAEFCSEHPDFFFEMTAEGELVVMPPTYTLTGIRNSEITARLRNWSFLDGRGFISDSSTGFVLPNGARRSPDAAWTEKLRIREVALESAQAAPGESVVREFLATLDHYWHLCPDFVIELRSQTDRLPVLRAKMREWIANGAQLAWLIDPERRAIEIFRPDSPDETRLEITSIEGEGPVEGFTLDLRLVWDPLGR